MTSWTTRVEWTTTDDYDPDAIDVLLEHLAELHPSIGREPTPDTWSATLTLEATTVRQAFVQAVQAVEAATGERVAGVEVLRTEVADARAAHPTIPPLVGHAEIADILGVSRQRAGQLADTEGFPPAVATPRTGPLRVRSQVEAWAETRQRRSGPRSRTTPGEIGTTA